MRRVAEKDLPRVAASQTELLRILCLNLARTLTRGGGELQLPCSSALVETDRKRLPQLTRGQNQSNVLRYILFSGHLSKDSIQRHEGAYQGHGLRRVTLKYHTCLKLYATAFSLS